MNEYQKQIALKDLYFEGDENVDRCLLCGCLAYKSELQIVKGEYICSKDNGCDLDSVPGDNKEEMVIAELDRMEKRAEKCREAMAISDPFNSNKIVEDFFQTLSNIFKPANQN